MIINKLGIIGAMDEEVISIKNMMISPKISTYASMEFYEGNIHGKDIIAVRSGIGKVNAAICVQILINIFKVDGIVNTGIAGSLKNEINIGDIVLSIDVIQHDVDATGFGYDYGIIPRMENSIFQSNKSMLDLAYNLCEEYLIDIKAHKGRILTGDQFIADSRKKEWLINQFKGYCTEMEGGAIAQASYLNDIPFLIIRSISDKADNSAQISYDEFEELAIKNTVLLLDKLIEKFGNIHPY